MTQWDLCQCAQDEPSTEQQVRAPQHPVDTLLCFRAAQCSHCVVLSVKGSFSAQAILGVRLFVSGS